MKSKRKYTMSTFASLLAAVVYITACEKNPVDLRGDNPVFTEGVLIVNEGNFLAGNSSLSLYDPIEDSVYNQVFYRENGAPLGDVANSVCLWEGKAYIPINNSGRIYIMDPYTFNYLGKITGLTSPRNLVVINDQKAYVTDLWDKKISIVHPTSFKELDSSGVVTYIDLNGYTAEEILLSGNKAFAACWSYGDRIYVIDTSTDLLLDSIQVGIQPNSMVMDKNSDIWVLCDGGYPGSPSGQENASIWRLNVDNHTAMRMLEFSDIMASPAELEINPGGDTLYYLNGDIYYSSIDNIREEVFIGSNGRFFYSLGVDPLENDIYVSDAVDFQQNGWVYRYNPSGTMIDSFSVGINPGSFFFLESRQ